MNNTDILIKIGADISDLSSKMKSAQSDVKGFGSSTESSVGKGIATLGKLAGAFGLVAIGTKIMGTLKKSIGSAFDRIDVMERFERTMTVLTGSTESANSALEATREAVTGTAYGLDVAAKGVQDFVTRGMDVQRATDTMEAWGDAVAFYGDGSNEQLANVSDALAKMVSKGKVGMDQMNRLYDAGIDGVGMYAQATGRSTESVQKDLSSGAISADEFVDTVTEAMMNGTNGVENIAGAAKDAGTSWGASMDNMDAAVTRGMVAIVKEIDNMLTSNGLPDMREMIAEFGSKFESALNNAAKVIGPFLDAVIKIALFLKPIAPIIEALVLGLTAFGVIMGVVAGSLKIWSLLTIAVKALNKAFLANPYVLAIAAIIALAYLIYKYWDEIVAATKIAWEWVSNFLSGLWADTVSLAKTAWGGLVDFFSGLWDGIVDGAVSAWNGLVETMTSIFSGIADFFTGVWDGITAVASAAWNGLVELASTVFGGIADFFTGIWTSITETATSAWTGFTETLSSIWTGIVEMATTVWSTLSEAITAVVGPIVEFVITQFTTIKDGVMGIFDGLSTYFTGAWELIKNVFLGAILLIVDLFTGNFGELVSHATQIFDNIKDAASQMWEGITQVFSTAVETVKTVFTTGFEAFKTIVSTAMTAVTTTISTAWNAVVSFLGSVLSTIVSSVTSGFNSVVSGISSALSTALSAVISAWNSILSFITSTVSSIISGVISGFRSVVSGISSAMSSALSAVISAWNSIVSGISSAISTVISTVISGMNSVLTGITSAWNAVKNFFSTTLPALVTIVRQGFSDMVSAIIGKMVDVLNSITTGWNNAKTFLTNIDLKKIGSDIIQGLINGIKSKIDDVKAAVKGAADAITGKIKGILGIKSPSRVLAKIGQHTGQGLVNGIAGMKSRITDAAANMAEWATPDMNDVAIPQPAGFDVPDRGIGTASIRSEQAVQHAIEDRYYNDKKPANITLELGGREFEAFAEDIDGTIQRKERLKRKTTGRK